MRSRPLAVVLAALAATIAIAPAASASTGTEVTLRAAPAGFVVPSLLLVNNPSVWIVDPSENGQFNDLSGVAGCDLTVTDRNGNGAVDAVDVLNRAEEAGCVSNWHGRNDDSCTDGTDVFVAEVDGLAEVFPATFWLIQRNGELANNGACAMALTDGDTLGFVYQ